MAQQVYDTREYMWVLYNKAFGSSYEGLQRDISSRGSVIYKPLSDFTYDEGEKPDVRQHVHDYVNIDMLLDYIMYYIAANYPISSAPINYKTAVIEDNPYPDHVHPYTSSPVNIRLLSFVDNYKQYMSIIEEKTYYVDTDRDHDNNWFANKLGQLYMLKRGIEYYDVEFAQKRVYEYNFNTFCMFWKEIGELLFMLMKEKRIPKPRQQILQPPDAISSCAIYSIPRDKKYDLYCVEL
jgi:hypothetical protein